ncbi:MAG: pyridoxamine 5'-phosphate oxidase family protein [candidate division WOR-3 bacterium]|nr:MAG: pyridoxamine 5'-phosphate oxidase family protein [candidate division WOR-3 bacterium]
MAAKDKAKIRRIIKETKGHAFLATVDRQQPAMRSIAPILGPGLTIWVATYASSRKVRQIRKNPRVALQFTSQPDGHRLVLVLGRARIVRDMAEKKRAWKLAGYDMFQYWPEGPGAAEYCLLRIVPRRIEWREDWTRTNVYRPGP